MVARLDVKRQMIAPAEQFVNSPGLGNRLLRAARIEKVVAAPED